MSAVRQLGHNLRPTPVPVCARGQAAVRPLPTSAKRRPLGPGGLVAGVRVGAAARYNESVPLRIASQDWLP